MIQNIKEEVEKILLLNELGEEFSSKPDEESQLKLDVVKEQILKSTYTVKKILNKFESKL